MPSRNMSSSTLKSSKYPMSSDIFMSVKISVLKTLTTKDVFRDQNPGFSKEVCPRHKVGEVFLSETHECPSGFCSWAYADIQKDVTDLHFDSPPYYNRWLKGHRVNYVSCTMGQHPVIFKIERVNNE
jgi:uncharacterized repeat protein (TIGR04076 family)